MTSESVFFTSLALSRTSACLLRAMGALRPPATAWARLVAKGRPGGRGIVARHLREHGLRGLTLVLGLARELALATSLPGRDGTEERTSSAAATGGSTAGGLP
jgi:hypothetical protein